VLDEWFDHVDLELDRCGSDRRLRDIALVIAVVHEHMFARPV
jgi:hypothetical protein